jgi:hypothetical protein
MPSKPIELPPEVAKAFVADMRAFFARGEVQRPNANRSRAEMPLA